MLMFERDEVALVPDLEEDALPLPNLDPSLDALISLGASFKPVGDRRAWGDRGAASAPAFPLEHKSVVPRSPFPAAGATTSTHHRPGPLTMDMSVTADQFDVSALCGLDLKAEFAEGGDVIGAVSPVNAGIAASVARALLSPETPRTPSSTSRAGGGSRSSLLLSPRPASTGGLLSPKSAAASPKGGATRKSLTRSRSSSSGIRAAAKATAKANSKSPTPNATAKATPKSPKSPLPVDHRAARGRGRAAQLAAMTPAQIAAEADIRAKKNRQAARDCRLRRKSYVGDLKARAAELEILYEASQDTIARLEARLALLEGR